MAAPRLATAHPNARAKASPLPSFVSDEPWSSTRRYAAPWFTYVYLPLPAIRGRRLRVPVPVLRHIHHASVSRFGRIRGNAVSSVAAVIILWLVINVLRRMGPTRLPKMSDPSSLVFGRADLQRIWQWEIASGHYPSTRLIPEQIALSEELLNPALPMRTANSEYRTPSIRPASGLPMGKQRTVGTGESRIYLDIAGEAPNTFYPPRPVPGSIADLDIIMEHCDFSNDKYVRDCLEVLRIGGGLDNQNRLRRGNTDDWKYIYVERPGEDTAGSSPSPPRRGSVQDQPTANNSGLVFRHPTVLERPLRLTTPGPVRPPNPATSCDPDHPRLFHMFWTGPFTDKPYMALMSFLYTQNLGLHLAGGEGVPRVCRPQFWLWINPGPAAAVPNPDALQDMLNTLEENPWSSPFAHARFKDVIKFKMWNTTEQLDGIPEIKNEWRQFRDTLFNSGGHIMKIPKKVFNSTKIVTKLTTTAKGDVESTEDAEPSPTNGAEGANADDMFQRTGSKSQNSYDRMSVVLSDMARFVLCHRFGGTYLDADTLLLRDWEELWGWRGAFAYRWSRLEKYNTAVLRLNKGSALGSFLFRTALRHGLDFHPMTVSKYTKDSYLEPLLLRLPDAMFDSAWLNTEYYQRDRPPYPFFHDFRDFFETPAQNSAAPQALGFNGFFKGAYAYHWHNFWWLAFDPSRNWPDLGERFMAGERRQRGLLKAAKAEESARLEAALAATMVSGKAHRPALSKVPAPLLVPPRPPYEEHLLMSDAEDVSSDKRDLDWAAVMKRTFEAYIRGETPNMYGEWLVWA